jgi:hypothetical protein
MNGRRNEPGTTNATEDEIRAAYELIHAAKVALDGAELPLDLLDRLVPPMPCRRTRLRLKAAAEGRRFNQTTRGER